MSRSEPEAGSPQLDFEETEPIYDMRLLVLLAVGLCLIIVRLSGCNFSFLNQSAEYHPLEDYNRYVWLSGLNTESGLYNLPNFNLQDGSDEFIALYDDFGLNLPQLQQENSSAEFFSFKTDAMVPVQGLYLESGRYPERTSVPARLASLFFQPMPINRASKEELCTLPGIGPQLAGRIIELREKKGGALSPSDLQSVSGIGHAKSSRLKKHISFE